MVKHKFYYDERELGVKDYNKFVAHLKKDIKSNLPFLMELAASYSMFKSLLKMRKLKILDFERDGMEERHIKFVDRLRKDIPTMDNYIEKTRLK